jgi:polyketide cyclase/dehydrase/lipid transport protein
MAERSVEQSIEIQAAPEDVHAFLADLHRHRELHPLIERVDDLPGHPGRPTVRRYRVTDRMRLGPLAFRITYVAEIEPFAPDLILGAAWQSPGIEVRTRYRITPTPAGGTLLHEEVLLKAPLLLVGYAHRQAEAAHRETFAKLKVVLEAGSARDAAAPREQRQQRDPGA